MNEDVIAIRYARALAEHANACGDLKNVAKGLEILGDLLDPTRGEITVPEILDFLRSPRISRKEKIQKTARICQELELSGIVTEFLHVLIRRNRIRLITRIIRQFERIARQLAAEKIVLVETPRSLTEAQVERLRRILPSVLGERRLEVVQKVKPELWGGVRIRFEDQILDGSLETQFKRLEAQLQEG